VLFQKISIILLPQKKLEFSGGGDGVGAGWGEGQLVSPKSLKKCMTLN